MIQLDNISFDHCIKCTVCTAYCPVARATIRFPGPKRRPTVAAGLQSRDGLFPLPPPPLASEGVQGPVFHHPKQPCPHPVRFHRLPGQFHERLLHAVLGGRDPAGGVQLERRGMGIDQFRQTLAVHALPPAPRFRRSGLWVASK